MKIKLWCGLAFAVGLLATPSFNAAAKQGPLPYGDNIFCWDSDVFYPPTSRDVVRSTVNLIGRGGIKIDATRVKFDRYDVCIDGSALTNSGGAIGATSPVNAARVDTDFNAVVNGTYFVTKTASCTLPSAASKVGKEILVWNACTANGIITYKTTDGQTISGAASGSMNNAVPYKLDRFMSDGNNWYRE